MLRLPSQGKPFRPVKAPKRPTTAPPPGPKPTTTPKSTQTSTQVSTQSVAPASTQDVPSNQPLSQPSMLPPSLPVTQTTVPSQSDDLPPSLASTSVHTSQIDPRVIIESEDLARKRQASAAPSTTTSTARTGRPALIAAAAARTAAGDTSKKSKGRIPSRSSASQSARAASSTPAPASTSLDRPSGPPGGTTLPPQIGTAPVSSMDIPVFRPPESPRPTTSSGLPPTIATTGSSSTSQGINGVTGAGRAESARPAPQTASRRAAAAGRSSAQRRAPKRNNARGAAATAIEDGAEGDEDMEDVAAGQAGSSTGPGTQSGATTRKRKVAEKEGAIVRPKRVRRRAYLGPDKTGNSAPSQLEVSQKRGAYRSRGKQGTSADGRLGKNKKKRGEGVPKSIPELSEANAGDHLGDEVDIEETTMGALATNVTVGKVSARALVLHEHQRQVSKARDKERPKRIEKAWKRKQAQRRKLRAERNAERAVRRQRFEELGTDSVDVVSDDEEDSEEEFEDDPEWFRNLDDEEDIRRGRQAREQNGEDEQENGRDPMEGDRSDGGDAEEEDDPEVDARSGEDEHDAALRASGFIVTQNRRRGEDDDEDGDSDNEDQEDDTNSRDGVDFDLEAYRREVEERRRRNLERVMGQGVVEENDELKMVNSASYGRKQSSERWTPEDTDMFYVALAEVGPTPLYLNEYFRGRTHRQLKNKLNREAELDPIRFNAALMKRRRPDTTFLNQNRGIDLLSPHEAETELFESAALGKINAKRRDLGLPDEEPQDDIPMAENVMPDGEQEE